MKFRAGKHFSPAPAGTLIPFDLWGANGWCNQEIVGESHYLPNLQRLFGQVSTKHRDLETSALLLAEMDNRHDANAVAVQIEGDVVGYLPRDIAAKYRPCLMDLAADGFVARVACRVWGGLVTDYENNRAGRLVEKERFTASVTVALADPHLCTPVNPRPADPHMLLPDGGAIQISGEDQCMPAIEPVLRPEGEAHVYVTLHELRDLSGRVAKELVEVRLGGLRVGQLTPKMSGDLLPAVRHLQEIGQLTAAKAKVRGNRLKAEITLHCARAHELPADWPGEQTAIRTAQRPTDLGNDPVAPPTATVAALGGGQPTVPIVVPVGHPPVPPKPTRIRFVPAPGWPPPPDGWEPPAGWLPDDAWPPAPAGWQFWVAE
jgi:collagen type III alpha